MDIVRLNWTDCLCVHLFGEVISLCLVGQHISGVGVGAVFDDSPCGIAADTLDNDMECRHVHCTSCRLLGGGGIDYQTTSVSPVAGCKLLHVGSKAAQWDGLPVEGECGISDCR